MIKLTNDFKKHITEACCFWLCVFLFLRTEYDTNEIKFIYRHGAFSMDLYETADNGIVLWLCCGFSFNRLYVIVTIVEVESKTAANFKKVKHILF